MRRLNPALLFLCVDFMLYVFLVKDVCLFLSYLIQILSCGVIVVPSCCRPPVVAGLSLLGRDSSPPMTSTLYL